MSKYKKPMQVQLSNMEICPIFSDLDKLSPIEMMLVSQTIPGMFIAAKTKVAKHQLKKKNVF